MLSGATTIKVIPYIVSTQVVNIENLPFDHAPDKTPYNKTFGLKRTSKVIYYPPTYKKIVDIFLKTEFSNVDRHINRVRLIEED